MTNLCINALVQLVTACSLLISVASVASCGSPKQAESVFDVRDYGAKGNGTTLDTQALQHALDACGAAGGGTVVLPPGTYLSQPLVMRTKTTLRLEKGATLKATDDPATRFRGRTSSY